eukprot:TRINITY_DN2363_c2_g1_i2.p1 TRINITY_DN2363_c2_g1~~TRINITY_DN2363_c2_g1_i2.p1  ORF type:complete len:319 (-),score=66.52 TRINITY_DN2363_c2_g1_i2:112-1068(-)
MADGGTGSPGSESVLGHQVEGSEVEADALAAPPAEEEADLCEYARTLGVDPDTDDQDLMWVVHQAFGASLPCSWAEFADDTGRVYYFHDASGKTTWEHPMDEVFRELVLLIKRTRADLQGAPEASRLGVVRQHLQQVHRRALEDLEVWSGPYSSDQGDYWYNESLKASVWECPVVEWQNELTTRHLILTRCLLGNAGSRGVASEVSYDEGVGGVTGRDDLLEMLRLQLGLLRRESVPGEVPTTPSTARTFYTARSAASSRSKHSAKSDRKQHRHKKDRGHRDGSTLEEQPAAPPGPGSPVARPPELGPSSPTSFQPVD